MCWRSMASLIGYDASGIHQLAMLRHKNPLPVTQQPEGVLSAHAPPGMISTRRA